MNLNENKLNYVLNAFYHNYYIKDNYDIHYGFNNKSKIQISSQGSDLKLPETKNIIFKNWKDIPIPFLFDTKDAEIISHDNSTLTINFDIIASIFYILSGFQEYHNSIRDDLNRFPYKESIQYKLGITEIPIVNYYFDILRTAIEKAYNITIDLKSEFTTCISHDIDKCNTGWIEDGFFSLKKGRIFSFIKLVFKKIVLGKDNWFNFDSILNFEKKNNIRSTFYFLTNKEKHGKYSNADYDITSNKLKNIFTKIVNANSEVGLHGGFGTFNNKEKFNSEIDKLNSVLINYKIKGTRFHFLSYEIRTTPSILSASELYYDKSLGFAENIGFRNGICTPFYLYDFENERPFSEIINVPLIVMDSSLQSKNYMGLTFNNAILKVKDIISEIIKFNGCFTVLWHNSLFADYKYSGWKRVFEEIINFCKMQDSIFISSYELAYKWQSQLK